MRLLRRILAEEGLTGTSWRDYFSPDAEGLHKKSWKHHLVMMTPDEFLSLALPGQSTEKEETVQGLISRGERFNSIPTLTVGLKKNKHFVEGHEGRHRMRALKKLGIKVVPVLIETHNTTWYPGDSHLVFDQASQKKSVSVSVPA